MATTITFPFPEFGVLLLDACTSQQHGRGAEITRHKVEKGSEVTDHVRPGPQTLSINGLVAFAPPRDVIAAALGAFLGDANRHIKAFDRLMKAIDKSELVTVETGRKVYKNMALRMLDAPVEVKSGNDFVFTLQMEEVRFVEAESVKIPTDALGKLAAATKGPAANAASKPAAKLGAAKTQRQASAPQAKGAAPPKTPTPKQATRGQSLLSSLTGFGG